MTPHAIYRRVHDIIYGGEGNNIIAGGLGRDRFAYRLALIL